MHATASPATDRAEPPAEPAAPPLTAPRSPAARAAADDRQPRRRAAARAPGGRGAGGAAGRRACGRSCARARRTPTTATHSTAGTPTSRPGSAIPPAGGDVELLQLKLNWHLSAMRRLGLIVDGDFGGATARAVIAFKRFHNIRPRTRSWTARRGPRSTRPRRSSRPRPHRAGPGARVRPHHRGRPAPDHARGRLRRARADRRPSITSSTRPRGGARIHARPGPRGGAPRRGRAHRRRPRAASCSSRRTSPPRSAAPSTACCG